MCNDKRSVLKLELFGIVLAIGMNFGLYGISLKLLWSLLSWTDVGYLIVKLLK
jgi:hypothetical protein